MLAIISPAKTLDFTTPSHTTKFTLPELLSESTALIEVCRTLSPADLASLMHISDKLAGLNAARFAQWQLPFMPDNAKQAILAFKGDVYTGLQAEDFNDTDLDFAQQHLAILSGLYGLLRPLDLMQAYRLEMGTKLANPRGKNLYEFWGDIITQHLNQLLQQQGDALLINLASDEYFSAVNPAKIQGKIIKPVFLDYKNGKYKIISFYAKKARGLMSRYIIKNQITNLSDLKNFDIDGYYYDAEFSSENEYVFKREEIKG